MLLQLLSAGLCRGNEGSSQQCKAKQRDADGDCLIVRTGRRCAVLFVGHVPTVVVAVTDISCWDTAARVGTLELVVTTPYQHISHYTRTLNMLLNDMTWYQLDKLID